MKIHDLLIPSQDGTLRKFDSVFFRAKDVVIEFPVPKGHQKNFRRVLRRSKWMHHGLNPAEVRSGVLSGKRLLLSNSRA
jgi:hypothetical protein